MILRQEIGLLMVIVSRYESIVHRINSSVQPIRYLICLLVFNVLFAWSISE